MPLSSARDISGQSKRAAIVAAHRIRGMFDSKNAIANLQMESATIGGY
jgi:hypothetical protein